MLAEGCWSIVREPHKVDTKKKYKKDILKLSTCKVICTGSVKILCVNKFIKSSAYWKQYTIGHFYLQILV
jgi:hypothetical protein